MTSQVAVFPFLDVTVMTVSPSAMAVTLPLTSTVAIFSSSEVQETLLSVAFSGRTVAVRVSLSPISRVSLLELSLISVTSTSVTVESEVVVVSVVEVVVESVVVEVVVEFS